MTEYEERLLRARYNVARQVPGLAEFAADRQRRRQEAATRPTQIAEEGSGVGWGPFLAGAGSGVAAAALLPASLPIGGMLGAASLAGLVSGVVHEGVQSSLEGRDFEYGLGRAAFDVGTHVLPAAAIKNLGKTGQISDVMEMAKRWITGADDASGARSTRTYERTVPGTRPSENAKQTVTRSVRANEVPDAPSLGSRLPTEETVNRGPGYDPEIDLLDGAAFATVAEIPSHRLPGELARLNREIAKGRPQYGLVQRRNQVQTKLDSLQRQPGDWKNGNLVETAKMAFSQPLRTLSNAAEEGSLAATNAAKSQYLRHRVEAPIKQHFDELRTRMSQYLPEDSPVRTNLLGLLEGDISPDMLTSAEKKLFKQAKADFIELDEFHRMYRLMVADRGVDGATKWRPYKSQKTYAPHLRTKEAIQRSGGKESHAGMVGRTGSIPEEDLARDFDTILDYIINRHARIVADEFAYGGARVQINANGQLMDVPALFLQHAEEMGAEGMTGLRSLLQSQLATTYGKQSDSGLYKVLANVRDFTTRAQLRDNYITQLSEAGKGMGWAGGIKNYERGKKWFAANEGAEGFLKETVYSARDSLLDFMPDVAKEYWVPFLAKEADRLARTFSIQPMVGRVLELTDEFKIILQRIQKGGILKESDKLLVREIAPDAVDDEAIIKVLGQYVGEVQRYGTLSQQTMRDAVAEMMTDVFQTYAAETVAPIMMHPLGKAVFQYRHFALNAAGMYNKKIIRPLQKARQMIRTGDATQIADAKDIIHYTIGKAGSMAIWSIAPLTAGRMLKYGIRATDDPDRTWSETGQRIASQVLLDDLPGSQAGLLGEAVSAPIQEMLGVNDYAIENLTTQVPMISMLDDMTDGRRAASAIMGAFAKREHGLAAPLMANTPDYDAPISPMTY